MSAHYPSRRYREVQVGTASKDELLLLLVDGAVRFGDGALLEMEKGKGHDISARNDLLLKAQRIVLELMTALSPVIGLELYENLQGLYRFTFQRLFEGNARSDLALVRDGVRMLHRIRDLWRDAIDKARSERDSRPARPAPNSTLSVEG